MFSTMSPEESIRHNQQLITRFQQEIGIDAFNQAEQKIPLGKGIVLDEWPNLLQFFPSTESGWELEDDSIYFDTGGIVERDWTFDKEDDARVSVWVFVSTGNEPKELLSRLAQFGIMTSKLNAYKLGPKDLGNISITTNAETLYVDDIFWVNHNVLVKISRRESSVDVLTIAHSFNTYLNQHIASNISNYAPKIDKIEISPTDAKINEPIWLKLEPVSKSDIPYLLGPELESTKDNNLDIQSQDTLAIQLKIAKPGEFEIPMWVGDKRTLLSSRIVARVTVLPDNESNNH